MVYWVLNEYVSGLFSRCSNERRRRIEEGQHNAEKNQETALEAELRYREIL